jgi:hypothetical protein
VRNVWGWGTTREEDSRVWTWFNFSYNLQSQFSHALSGNVNTSSAHYSNCARNRPQKGQGREGRGTGEQERRGRHILTNGKQEETEICRLVDGQERNAKEVIGKEHNVHVDSTCIT